LIQRFGTVEEALERPPKSRRRPIASLCKQSGHDLVQQADATIDTKVQIDLDTNAMRISSRTSPFCGSCSRLEFTTMLKECQSRSPSRPTIAKRIPRPTSKSAKTSLDRLFRRGIEVLKLSPGGTRNKRWTKAGQEAFWR